MAQTSPGVCENFFSATIHVKAMTYYFSFFAKTLSKSPGLKGIKGQCLPFVVLLLMAKKLICTDGKR